MNLALFTRYTVRAQLVSLNRMSARELQQVLDLKGLTADVRRYAKLRLDERDRKDRDALKQTHR